MNRIEAINRISEIIAESNGIDVSKISIDADLYGDLGIDGDDAKDTIENIAREFSIDLSAIDYNKHFGPEAGFNPMAIFLPRWWRWRKERIPITPSDLADSALAQEWSMVYPE